jgi:hypothetical protein
MISFGVIGLIGAWWIMISFLFWKIMLGIPVGVMFLLNRENFVTKNYKNKSILPEWNVQWEKFWLWISKVENNVDYGVCV